MKNTRNILKAIIAIGIALAFIMPGALAVSDTKAKTFNDSTLITNTEPYNRPSSLNAAVFEDGFENYENFALDFPPWTQFDGDGGMTWGSVDYNFTNENYVGSFMIFNASATEPPSNGTAWDSHSGDKYAACFASIPPDNPNDDWLITPEIEINEETFYISIHCVSDDSFVLQLDDFAVTETAEGFEISFWAKSITDAYGLDRFQVGVSTTDNNISSFEIITDDPYVEPPTEWTEFTYTYELVSDPEFAVNITGGLGITATVENIGEGDATNVSANISLDGGFILVGGENLVDIGDITSGNSGFAKSTVIGIGKTNITVTITCDEGVEVTKTASGFVLLFFVLGV